MSTGTLLIVDDNPTLTALVESYMSRIAGWRHVVIAADAGHGLMLAASLTPSAIVLDNRMPGGSGLDVLAELRRTCPGARIVMHTADDTTHLRTEAERLGADAVVPKGRPLDELAALLAAA